MYSKLTCNKLKIDCYNCKRIYAVFMITTEQNDTVVTQKIKRKESMLLPQKILKLRRKVTIEKGTKATKPKSNIMTIVSPYLSIITLYVNRLNYSIKRHRENGLKK